MQLYSYWRSSCSWRVRIALAWKGLDYTYLPVNLLEGDQHSEEHRARNPMRQVPYLWDDGFGLAQSMAILEYLEETVSEPALLPSDPRNRARARQLAEMINAGIQPLQNFAVLQMLEGFEVDKKAWSQSWIARGFAALEKIAEGTAGQYLVGDTVTFADLMLVPQMYNARRFGVVLDNYPTLVRVDAACAELPAFQASHPDAQPDAPQD